MKHLAKFVLAAAAIAFLAAPVSAATEWTFTGGLYYKAFWNERDFGKERGEDLQGGGAELKSDGMLDWTTQGDSYIGMEMVSDHLEGYIELQYDFDENKVKTNYFWGRYNFNENISILIGQTDPLFMQEISNQVIYDNMNMNGVGTANSDTLPMIALAFNGFTVALAKPMSDIDAMEEANAAYYGLDDFESDSIIYDQDTFMPQIQVSYAYEADEWRFKVAGAFASTRVKSRAIDVFGNGDFMPVPGKKNHNSWLVGADTQVYFGPLTLGAAASYGANWDLAGWNESLNGFSFPIHKFNGGYGNPKFKDTYSLMLAFVGNYQLTEALGFEAGGGYRRDDNSYFAKACNTWTVYAQAVYEVAPGFVITPEIGYIDYGKGTGYKMHGYKDKGLSQGYEWYAGVQFGLEF